MNRDACGFSLSFFLHASIVGICIYMLPALDLQPKPLVIDFSLITENPVQNISTAPPIEEKPIKPPAVIQQPIKPRELVRPKPIKKVLSRPTEKILPKKEEKVVSEKFVPEEAPISQKTEIPVVQPQVATSVNHSLIQRNSSLRAVVNEGVSRQAMKQHYVKSHFIYIKKIIERNISYPPMARRMGWQGKVMVSFVVCKDGKVEDLHVIESSGYSQLDKNAIETVRQVGPFPSPPVRVKLVLPVNYTIS